MKTRVCVEQQVRDFLHTLAPEPRRAVWRAIKRLPRGDVKQLEGKLAPYWRLKAGRVRVIYSVAAVEGERRLSCFFADYRATVYEVLEQLLLSGLIEAIIE